LEGLLNLRAQWLSDEGIDLDLSSIALYIQPLFPVQFSMIAQPIFKNQTSSSQSWVSTPLPRLPSPEAAAERSITCTPHIPSASPLLIPSLPSVSHTTL
jgi:hypothetical protein